MYTMKQTVQRKSVNGSGSSKQRATDLAYQRIRADLMRGRWPKGTHLREVELAAELRMSRTPVREALRRLAAEAHLVLEPHLGATVQGWTRQDIEEIFDLRMHLEGLAAERAARLATPEQIEALSRLAVDVETVANLTSEDLPSLMEANDRFHRLIFEAAGNRRLAKLTALLVEGPLQVRTFERYDERALRRSLNHHVELVEAIRARDPLWARSVMQAHVLAGQRVMMSGLDLQNDAGMCTTRDRIDSGESVPEGEAARTRTA
jgi:DNA-binding GntR family transcriptional regulator